jgi:hypothetical protein
MMSSEKKWFRQPLGEVLQQAYLVSAFQLEEALKEQATGRVGTIGEILAAKGWLKKETADFFASQWAMLVNQPDKKPLGYYLKEAALLDEAQIHQIVSEQGQERLWIRLGTNAVLKGWLSQSTVDFFVENLFPEYAADSPFVAVRKNQ